MLPEEQVEKNYAPFNAQKIQRLQSMGGRLENFEMANRIVFEQLVGIDITLDAFATSIDHLAEIISGYTPKVNYDELINLMHTVRRDPEFVNRPNQKTEAQAVYGINIRNVEAVKKNVEQLEKFLKQLRTMKFGGVPEKFPEVFKLLRMCILPGDMVDKPVIDFLIDDVIELKEIYEQVYDELALFKAISKLIESFPRDLVDQMVTPTPTQ